MHAVSRGLRNICAVITHFSKTGETIDFESRERHFHRLKENKVDAIVSLGTTGECPTVPFGQHEAILKQDVLMSPLPIIAGAGGNSTAEAVHLTREAEKDGVMGVLSVAPYYNKPTQEGLYRHFVKICRSTSLPVLAYNVPGRTVISIDVETTLRIRDYCGNFAGIKEASNNLVAVERYVHEGVPVYCGEDALNFVMLCLGAQGVISVVSNFAGLVIAHLIKAVTAGNLGEARVINNMVADLSRAAFREANPIPTKYICSKLGLCNNSLRLPLTPLSRKNQQFVLHLARKHIGYLPG